MIGIERNFFSAFIEMLMLFLIIIQNRKRPIFLTHWRPIPIHYQDWSFLHCRPILIVYRDQFYIFFHFRTIPDTVSGLGFSVCYLLFSFHSKFRSGGVHSFYFTKLLRNPTQLDKLLLTISKWQRTLLKIEANCWRISVKIYI